MQLLLAEDDPTILHLLTRLFENDYEVAAARNGDDAWECLVRNDGPRLAVLDWHMPGLHGTDICRKAHTQPEPTYILLLTATRTRPEDVLEAFEAGADDYVLKPFAPQELRARVAVGKRTLDLHRTLSERVAELEEAVSRIRKLEGLLRICAWCKRVQNDEDRWEQLEAYITEHSDAIFSHGICPECALNVSR